MQFINKLFGALINFIFFIPFMALGIILIPFMFIEYLLKGQIKNAFFEFLKFPVKISLFITFTSMMSINNGWDYGIVNLFTNLGKNGS